MRNFRRFTIIAVASLLFICLGSISRLTQVSRASSDDQKKEETITIRSAGRGLPQINFDDGKELATFEDKAQSPGSQPTKLISADFDSDGVPDLVTVDLGGALKLYRGNLAQLYPNSPQAKSWLLQGLTDPRPLLQTKKTFYLSSAPDFFFAGDFNADGRQDILAATRGRQALHLLAGDGAGNFARETQIPLGGAITTVEAGEIGRADGQTDVAAAIVNKDGAQLLVFEHPEGAFKHKPELIKLGVTATDSAIGHVDGDSYGDIALAAGSHLTIVHGRGQAYPFDMLSDSGIKRPAAHVQTRQFSFSISSLAIGHFGERRGDHLAMLAGNGSVNVLELSSEAQKSVARSLDKRKASALSYVPAEGDAERYSVLAQNLPQSAAEAKRRGMQLVKPSLAGKNNREIIEALRQQSEEAARELSKLSSAEQAKYLRENLQQMGASRQQAKAEFMKSLAPRPLPLARFNLQTLVSDSRLAQAGNARLIKARVSNSGKDDLLLLNSANQQIQIITQIQDSGNPQSTIRNPQSEVVSLETEGAPLEVLPMRLNSDARSDLVVLRAGSPNLSVVTSAAVSTYVVTTTDDSGEGSLRRAITRANESAGADAIIFNIGSGVQTITPATQLPDIIEAVTIDGTTQPGFSGKPLIEIKGVNVPAGKDGLRINTSNCVVRGLVVNEFKSEIDENGFSQIGGNGIAIFNYSGGSHARANIIEGNYLGTDPTGTLDKGNDSPGLLIFGSDDNIIGGTTSAARNVMSGNGNGDQQLPLGDPGRKRGVGLAVTVGNNTQIKGNFIGTDASGVFSINNTEGIFLSGKNNLVGGDEAGAGNTVSGNGDILPIPGDPDYCMGEGIKVAVMTNSSGELLTLDNVFKGNLIGTTANGAGPLGNCSTGITFGALTNTTLGSITETGRNTISGNTYDAVHCLGSSGYFGVESEGGQCLIVGNNIGTDITGTQAIPNNFDNPVYVEQIGEFYASGTVWLPLSLNDVAVVGSPGGTTPGGRCTGFCNLISGNQPFAGGVKRSGFMGEALIVNNYIGTNQTGTAALPNNGQGVFLTFGDVSVGAVFTDQGGNLSSGGNLISGNREDAIFADAGNFRIVGNRIGTSADGASAVPNGRSGSGVSDLEAALSLYPRPDGEMSLGGTRPLERNIIAGNNGHGVFIEAAGAVTIFNNYIGVNVAGAPLGNSGHGVVVLGHGYCPEQAGQRSVLVGGKEAGEGNVIKNNGGAGVFLYEDTMAAHTRVCPGAPRTNDNVRITGNSIVDNNGLGIDLTTTSTSENAYFDRPDGITANDCLDADTGANQQQNYPELFTPDVNQDGTVSVTGFLRSAPEKTYTLDFYATRQDAQTNYGDGETYIGSKSITTDGNGFVTFTYTTPAPFDPSMAITATATDSEGNTSEFSCAAGVCSTSQDRLSGTKSDKAKALTKEQWLAEAEGFKCSSKIVVNITSDEEDANLSDKRCDVDVSANNGDQCSLRAAIQEANARKGADFIDFEIPGEGGHTIAPASQLPNITERVFINGNSQPGYTDNSPKILLSGVNVASGIGLNFVGGSGSSSGRGSMVSGLALNHWRGPVGQNESGGAAIKFTLSDNSVVESCHIGFDLGGAFTPEMGNVNGIVVESSQGVKIGGAVSSDGNVISNNTFTNLNLANGVVVEDSRDTVIQNNKIGTTIDGNAAARNGNGIHLKGSTTTNTQITDNLISGNIYGITIENSRPSGVNNRIANNLIGTTASGMAALKNLGGIRIRNSTNNLIEGNTISGNHSGIIVGEGTFDGYNSNSNQIYNNKIGVGTDGTTPIPNQYGIYIENSSHNQIGALGQPRNKISGNIEAGIYITGFGDGSTFIYAEGNNIINNDIGVSAGNQKDGIRLDSHVTSSEISHNNISGNGIYGLFVDYVADGHSIHDNNIGTGAANKAGLGIAGDNNSVFKNKISGNTEYNMVIGFALVEGDPDSIERHGFPSGNQIYDNRIENSKIGIVVGDNATDNVIGGAAPLGTAGNIISGHRTGDGIGILVTARGGDASIGHFPADNKFVGNIVGKVDSNSLPNKVGMVITRAKNNTIGAQGTGLGNIFIGNEEDGIKISGDQAIGNLINGNFVGINPSSPTDITAGNGRNGIYVVGTTHQNDITNNRIGLNRANGISVIDALPEQGTEFSLKVAGNQIGVARINNQVFRLPNLGAGIKLEDAQNVLVGSSLVAFTDAKNIISGNVGSGVLITGASSKLNVINNSIIGTDESGTIDIGNAGGGIRVVGGESNTIGGNSPIENTIAGNTGNGISLENSSSNKIVGNLIGVVQLGNGIAKLPNSLNGILVDGAGSNEIGSSLRAFAFKNIIGGNGQSGIALQGSSTTSTKIINNFIGTNSNRANLGNTLHGVFITDGANNTNVGGQGVDTGNRIAFNGTQVTHGGVVLDNTAGTGNLIDPNEIFANAGLGIDLGADGRTPNDPADADGGPNRLQNYPDLVSAQIVNDELIINYKVDSAPGNSAYGAEGIYVEFFKADAGGEGEKFLGFDHYTAANYNNGSPIVKQINLGKLTTLGINANDPFTSTATDADDNSSEFSPVISVTTAAGVIQFNASTYTVSESAGTVAITVTRTGSSSGPVTVSYSDTPGTAGSSDYSNATGSVTFTDGDLAPKTFNVTIANDALHEPDETFKLTLSITSGLATPGTPFETTVTITNDDAPPSVNNAPAAIGQSLSINEDAATPLQITLSATDADNDALVFTINAQPAHGTLNTANLAAPNCAATPGTCTAVVTYTPAPNYNGPDSFTFKVSDNKVESASATVSINVTPVNDSPTGNDDSLTIAEDSPAATIAVLANDTFAPDAGETLAVTGVTQPAHGTASLTGGVVSYTPAADYNGQDSFTYTISDGNGGSASAKVDVTITPVNDAPVISDITNQSTPANTQTAAIAFTISDVDTPAASLNLAGASSNTTLVPAGNISFGGAGTNRTITITPAQNQSGTAIITITVSDGALTAADTFVLTVNPVPTVVQLSSPAFNVQEDCTYVQVSITRTGPATGTTVVDYATTDGTAQQRADYTIALGRLTFEPNETSKTVTLLISEDSRVEGNETFTLSLSNAAGGSLGPQSVATIQITDDATEPATNAIDDPAVFICQNYHDLLNRQPDTMGYSGWLNILNNCQPGDASCDRIEVSSAFYRSDEFQARGFFLYRFYAAALGRPPRYLEFMTDLSRTTGFLSDQQIEAGRVAFIQDFMSRQEFRDKYDSLTDPAAYVGALEQTAQVTLSNKQQLISDLQAGVKTRADVLRAVAESSEVTARYYNQAFVVMEYFGYLRRDPDILYLQWIQTLNQTGNYRTMINGFLNSMEYRGRFGQ